MSLSPTDRDETLALRETVEADTALDREYPATCPTRRPK